MHKGDSVEASRQTIKCTLVNMTKLESYFSLHEIENHEEKIYEINEIK